MVVEEKFKRILDFNIQGIVGIRFINPSPSDEKIIRYQLGLSPSPLTEEPDICIKFISHMEIQGLKYLGLNNTGFTDEAFYVLISSHQRIKMQIPFDKVGYKCEIICESGLNAIPLLNYIINLTFLNKGYLPIHGAAFVYNNTGILVTGWASSGKTEALLSFSLKGAHFIGDEWVFISKTGDKIFAVPIPISIKKWQFKYLKPVLLEISIRKRFLFTSIRILQNFNHFFMSERWKKKFPFDLLTQSLPLLERQLKIWVSPADYFKGELQNKYFIPEIIFLIIMHDQDDVIVEPASLDYVIQKIVQTNQYELLHFLKYYHAFKFAFPNKINPILENLESYQKALIEQIFFNKKIFKVYRPYPHVSFPELFKKMSEYC